MPANAVAFMIGGFDVMAGACIPAARGAFGEPARCLCAEC